MKRILMNKRAIFCLSFSLYLFVSVGIASVANAQTSGEDSISLNGQWFFKTDPYNSGEENKWFAQKGNTGAWEAMNVPFNWDLKNEYADYAGKAWYKKDIVVPVSWKGKTVRILFEAVSHDSKVWLNGKLLGTNNSGYLPFEFDVSKIINYSGANTFVVLADNTFRRGALWNWGGIRRPVYLVANNPVRIIRQYISQSVDLQKGTADVSIKVALLNAENKEVNVQGNISLAAKNGFRRTLPFTKRLSPNSATEVILSTSLDKNEVHLWHFDDPFLYASKVTIHARNKLQHSLTDRFALRKIEVDNQNFTFKLNGESVRLMGFNLVPDDRTTGNTLPLWRIKEDVDLMKSLGANMARLTHLPLHKEMLDYLDEKGVLNYAEIPLWGFDRLADKNNPIPNEWLKKLININYNHPSIIGWSVGNEIGFYPGVMEYVENAIQYVRTLDTTRLAVVVSHTADRNPDPIQFSDLGLINKYGVNIGKLADDIHKLYPDKILFYSEYGYGQLREDLDATVDAKGMVDSIRFKPYLIGGSLWTFNDYRSSFIGTKEFSENRPWGVVDVIRRKKKAFYAFRKEYAPVRELKVERSGNGSASITIIPRQVLDLPAYILRDYLLVWKATHFDGTIKGGFRKLPEIKPGDGAISETINWQSDDTISSLQVVLLSPLNYSVYDTTICFQKPPPPKIVYAQGGRSQMNNTPPNSGSIRVVFEKNDAAVAYKVKYGKDGLTSETESTINHFIDIPNLAFGETYQIAVVAINGAGATQSEIKKVQVGYGFAPPVIYYDEPADKGFFVGYATQADDYVFRLQYTRKAGDYSHAKAIQTTTKGVLFVPGLQNGQRYYYRLQRIKHNNCETSWSEEKSIMPDGGQLPMPPVVQGVLYQNGEAVICFKPVKKAIGYLVQYRRNEQDQWITLPIETAQMEHCRISNLEKEGSYQFRIASINQYGPSSFSPVLKAHTSYNGKSTTLAF